MQTLWNLQILQGCYARPELDTIHMYLYYLILVEIPWRFSTMLLLGSCKYNLPHVWECPTMTNTRPRPPLLGNFVFNVYTTDEIYTASLNGLIGPKNNANYSDTWLACLTHIRWLRHMAETNRCARLDSGHVPVF